MNHTAQLRSRRGLSLTIRGLSLSLGLLASAFAAPSTADVSPLSTHWISTWASSAQLVDAKDLPPAPGLKGATLRQFIRSSASGACLRVRISNRHGEAPLHLTGASLAKAAPKTDLLPGSSRPLLFAGSPSVIIPAGAVMLSDPLDFDLPPLSLLALTLQFDNIPAKTTGHPGSRTTSQIVYGAELSATHLEKPLDIDHWYYLQAVETCATPTAGTIVTLGDSITDGRGSTTNGNDRWPDRLAERLAASPDTRQLGIANEGIGGNCVLNGGLGQNALARFNEDVISITGARWLIILEGVNDIGGSAQARAKGNEIQVADALINAYRQLINRAHAAGLKVYGGTILPFGTSFYDLPGAEEDRQKVNHWIRHSGAFDAVIDFETAVKDPQNPRQLAPWADSGDHLHLSPQGYKALADSIDLSLFR